MPADEWGEDSSENRHSEHKVDRRPYLHPYPTYIPEQRTSFSHLSKNDVLKTQTWSCHFLLRTLRRLSWKTPYKKCPFMALLISPTSSCNRLPLHICPSSTVASVHSLPLAMVLSPQDHCTCCLIRLKHVPYLLWNVDSCLYFGWCLKQSFFRRCPRPLWAAPLQSPVLCTLPQSYLLNDLWGHLINVGSQSSSTGTSDFDEGFIPRAFSCACYIIGTRKHFLEEGRGEKQGRKKGREGGREGRINEKYFSGASKILSAWRCLKTKHLGEAGSLLILRTASEPCFRDKGNSCQNGQLEKFLIYLEQLFPGRMMRVHKIRCDYPSYTLIDVCACVCG